MKILIFNQVNDYSTLMNVIINNLVVILLKTYFFNCTCICVPLCMFTSMQFHAEARGIGFHGAGVTGSCEQPKCECWELNSCPLMSTTEPSLQPLVVVFLLK